MANDKPDIKKTTGKINSKWMQNAVKSLGLAGTEVIKEIFPATTSAVTSTSKLASDAIKSARDATKDSKSISNTLNQMSGVRMAKEVVENSIADLKSGKLYNPDRDPFSSGPDGFSEDDVDTMFGDIDDMFSDDGSGDTDSAPDIQINNQVVNRDGSSQDATIQVLQKTTQHQLQASKAQIDAMVSISSMQMARTSEMGAKIVDALDAINNNIASLIEFNNDNMSKLISSSISFYEQMGMKKEEEYSGGKGQVKPEDIFSNGFNASTYKDYIKQNINNSMLMSTLGMVTDQKDMIASNPVGMVLQATMKGLIPKVARSAMEEFDKTFSNFLPNMLERLSDWGEGGDTQSLGGMVRRSIGSVFGIKNQRTNYINPKKADPTPMPWNGMANHALIEVIPKYLRESTGYLQEIAEVITGKTRDEMSDKFVGYNWETGQYQGINDQRNQIADTFINNTIDVLQKSDFYKQLQMFSSSLKNKELGKQLMEMFPEFALRVEQHQGPIKWENQLDRETLFSTIKGGDAEAKKAMEGMILDMLENNSGALGDLATAKRKATQSRKEMISSYERNADENNIRQVLDGRSTDQWIEDRINAKIADKGHIEVTPVAKKVSVPTILSEINSVLHRGIYVVVKNRFPGEKGSDGDKNATVDTKSRIVSEGKPYVKNASGLIVPAPAPVKATPKPETTATVSDNPKATEKKEELTAQDYAGIYNFHRKEAEKASIQGEPDKYQLGNYTAGFFNTLSGLMNGIMNGDADRAFDNVMNSIYDKFANAGREISAKFLTPIKQELFGTKNEKTGYKDGGLFSGVTNRMRESMFALRHMITGEGYVGADGKKVEADTSGNTVKAKLTGMLHNLSNGIKVRIFGEKEDGKDTKEGILQKAQNGIAKTVSTFHKGLAGWKHAIFGDKYEDDQDPEKTGKEVWAEIKEKASKVLPSGLAGSAVGAMGGMMSGGVLGTLVGGPIGGALLGFAGGLASRSEKFKDWLFGPEDKDGNRAGGLISANTQKFFKEHAAFLTGGAALGAAKGAITGGGILGNLVGGPVAGALMGLGTAVVLKSSIFQKFLFGDEKLGQLGIVTLGKQWMRNIVSKSGEEGGVDGSKLLGMMGIGAASGGLLGTLVGGPILGASMGLGAAILAQKDNFHAWLFGEDDEKTGAHREGIFGQFKNAIKVSVLDPMKHRIEETAADAKRFLYYDVLAKLNIALEPIGRGISDLVGNISASVWDTTKSVGKYIKEDFLGGMIDATRSILTPVTEAATAAGSAIWTATKAIVAAPVNLLYAVTSPLMETAKNVIGTAVSVITTPIGLAIKGSMKILTTSIGLAAKTIGKAVALPFNVVSKAMRFINDKVIGTIAHIGRAGMQFVADVKDAVLNHGPIGWIRKQFSNAKDFMGVVKTQISEMFDPMKDAMKSAIKYAAHSITDHVKKTFSDSIHSFFNLLNPINWIKKGAKLLGFGKNKGDENKSDGKKGYFARLWEKTKYGPEVKDYSDQMVKDEDGNLIGRAKGFTRAQAYKNLKNANINEKNKNKEVRKANKDREYNQRMIAKYTKNQRGTDTEENRLLALAEAKRQGKNIEWRGEAIKAESAKKTELFQDKSVSIQENTNKTLNRIADFIMGRTPKQSLWDERVDQYNEGKHQGNLIGIRDKTLEEKRAAVVTDDQDKEIHRIQKNVDKARGRESKARQENYDKLFQERGFWGGLAAVNSNLRGIRKGIKAGKKGQMKYAEGTDNAKAGEALTGENGPEIIDDKKGNAVITGAKGPEVREMKGGEQVIPNGGIMGVFNGMLSYLRDIRDSVNTGFKTAVEAVDENTDVTKDAAPTASIADTPELPDNKWVDKNYTPQMNTNIAPYLTKHEPPKATVAFNKAVGKTAESQKAAAAAAEEKASDAEFKEKVTEGIEDVNEGVRSHNSIWNSIFSKKGLITGALILGAPLIFKFLKSIPGLIDKLINSLGDAGARFSEDLKFGQDSLGDGRNSGDVIGDELEGLGRTAESLGRGDLPGAFSNFVYDKDGQVYNETGAREKLLAHGAVDAANTAMKHGTQLRTAAKGALATVKGVGTAAKSAGKYLVSNFKTGVGLSKGLYDVASDEAVNALIESSGGLSSPADIGYVAQSTTKKASVKVGEFAGKTAEKIGKAAEATGVTKVIGAVKNFFVSLATKANAKFGGKISNNIFTKLITKVSGAIKKGWSFLSPKISKILSGAGALASTGIGLLAKEGTWVVLGAVNGATGAKRLFRSKDYVDAKMVAISAVFGGFSGTTLGSIVDCVNELIVSVLGIDMFTEAATLIYQLVSSEDDMNKLDASQDNLKNDYTASVDTSLDEQYDTMVKTGLIDSSVDKETWKEQAKNGETAANIQSFADYNDQQNQTLGSTVSKAVKNSFIGKGARGIKNALFGSTEGRYYDTQNQNVEYRRGDDGNYYAYDVKTGKQLSETGIDRSVFESDTDRFQSGDIVKEGAIKKAVTAVKDLPSNISNGVKNFKAGAAEKAGVVKAKFKDSVDSFNNWTNGVSEWWAQKDKEFTTWTSKQYTNFRKGVGVMEDKFSESWKSLNEWASGTWTNATTAASEWASNTWASIKTGTKVMGKKFSDSADSLGKFFTSIPGSVNSVMTSAGKKIGDLFTSTKEQVSTVINSTGELASAAFTGNSEKFNNAGQDIDDSQPIAKALIGVNKFLLSPISGISGFAVNMVKTIKNSIDATKNITKDAANYASTLSKYSDSSKSMNGFFNEKMSNADKNPVVKIVQSMVQFFMNMYVSLGRAISGVVNKVKDTAGNVGNWIKNLLGIGDKERVTINGFDQSDIDAYNAAVASGEFDPDSVGIRSAKKSGKGGRGIMPSSLNGGTYFSQTDSRWAGDSYAEANGNDANATMADSGCGPTAMAMALSDVTGKSPTPTNLARLAQKTGDRDDTGTNANFITNAANAYGVQSDETINPTPNKIINELRSSGNPMVLLGQSDGGNGPYTSSGHYIVAEGVDNNGNVVVNDPRGPEYSGSVAPSQLAGTTSSAWSFGGRGKRKNVIHSVNSDIGGYSGNREKWINIVAEVKRQIAASKAGYSNTGAVTVTIGGKSIRVRTDCSGLVSACLQFYGVMDKGQTLSSDSIADMNNSIMRRTGFTPRKFTSWKDLSKGDIVARHGHTEIFAAIVDGKKYVYNVGSTSSANDPYATPPLDQDHETVWSVGAPGKYAVTASGDGNVQVDKNYKGSSDDSGSTVDDSGSSTSTSLFSKITGAFSAVTSALFDSAISGQAPDWDKVVSEYKAEYNNSSNSSSYGDDDSVDLGDASQINADIIAGDKGMTTTGGAANQSTIWKSLRAFGLSKAGTAGLMGAWTAESGLRPNNLENQFESKYGNDREYTNKVDRDHKWPDSPTDNVGYGLAQWTGANGNTKSGSSRKNTLLALANGAGASVGNLGIQLQHAESELKSRYTTAYQHLREATTVAQGTAAALGDYEMPGMKQANAYENKRWYPTRLKFATEIYNKFANERRAGYGGRGGLSDVAADVASEMLVNYYDENAPKVYEKLTGKNPGKIDRKAIREQNAKREAEAKRRASLSTSEKFTEDVVAPIMESLIRKGMDSTMDYFETHVTTAGVDSMSGASRKAPAGRKNRSKPTTTNKRRGGRGSALSLVDIFGQDTLDQVSAMTKDLVLDLASDAVKDNRDSINKAISDTTAKATDTGNDVAAKLDEVFPGMGLGDSLKTNLSKTINENMPTINESLDMLSARQQSETTSRNLYDEAIKAYNDKDYATLQAVLSPNAIRTGSTYVEPSSNATIAPTQNAAASSDASTVQPQTEVSDSNATVNNVNYGSVTPESDVTTEQATANASSTGSIYTTTTTPSNVEIINQYQNAGGSSTQTTSQIVTLIGKVVDILGSISTNTNNLKELEDIKTGINNIHIPTLPASGGSGNGSSDTSKKTTKPSLKIPFSRSDGGFSSEGISNAELTARKIAFGI